MPNLTLMPGGINAAFAGRNSVPEKRGIIRGLSAGAARRHQTTLRSVDVSQLYGAPVTFTLTMRDVPESAEAWDRAKRCLWKRLRRHGVIRVHWCLEWTRRGVPHLHGIAFFPVWKGQPGRWVHDKEQSYWEVLNPWMIPAAWQEVAGQWGVSLDAQHVSLRASAERAWFRYMAKHSSRGVGHYQRQAESVPEGWKTTGRMWGTFGLPWPVRAEKQAIRTWEFHRLRRQVRALARSRAITHIRKGESTHDPKRAKLLIRQGKATLRYLGRLSQISDPDRSGRFPISEDVPGWVVDTLLEGIRWNYEPPARRHDLDIAESKLRGDDWGPIRPDEDEPLPGPDPAHDWLPY